MLDDGDDIMRADAWKAGGWGAMFLGPIYARSSEDAAHVVLAGAGMRRMRWWENLMRKGARR